MNVLLCYAVSTLRALCNLPMMTSYDITTVI